MTDIRRKGGLGSADSLTSMRGPTDIIPNPKVVQRTSRTLLTLILSDLTNYTRELLTFIRKE